MGRPRSPLHRSTRGGTLVSGAGHPMSHLEHLPAAAAIILRGGADENFRKAAMETVKFILHNLPAIGQRTIEHVSIVGVAVSLAIITGVPIGIAITQSKRAADLVLYVASMIMTIPSIALFGVMIPVLSLIGHGIGYLPAVIAVLLYSQLPIIRNTYTAINNVDPALREAARGMGMSSLERLRQVEIPLAVPVIMAGVRVAVVINIGITAIAAYIGAGGLGTFISRGITQTDSRQLVTGALAVSLLAIVVDYLLLWLQHRLTPVGIRPERKRKTFTRRVPA
jgi:osmoprotectant transport system permease protein